jgi:hypothetical protein
MAVGEGLEGGESELRWLVAAEENKSTRVLRVEEENTATNFVFYFARKRGVREENYANRAMVNEGEGSRDGSKTGEQASPVR